MTFLDVIYTDADEHLSRLKLIGAHVVMGMQVMLQAQTHAPSKGSCMDRHKPLWQS